MKTKKLTIIILIFGFFMVSFFECSDAGIAWDYKIVNCECEEDEIPLQGEISEETEIFKIEAKIPEIGNEKIDRELSDFVTKIISDFKQLLMVKNHPGKMSSGFPRRFMNIQKILRVCDLMYINLQVGHTE